VYLSVPSYVIPGTYLENVRLISSLNLVHSVELLFYLFDPDTEELFLKEKEGIELHNTKLGFSVHMPDRLLAEHEKIIKLTWELASRYILHPPDGDSEQFIKIVSGWTENYGKCFLLENINGRAFQSILGRIEGLRVCMDTGHLLMEGKSPVTFFSRFEESTLEIHLHGVKDGKDHNPVKQDEEWLKSMIPLLKRFKGTLNIELFSLKHIRETLQSLRYHGIVEEAVDF